MLSCVELGMLYYTGRGKKKDIKKAMLVFSKGYDISEHDTYCFKYQKLKNTRI